MIKIMDSANHIDTDPIDRLTCESCQAELAVNGVESFSEIQCPECGATLAVPAQLGGFRLLSLLGQGGMGAVYRGVDSALDRPVAVKVLLRSVGEDPVFVETFQREAKAAAALNHPNIVQIYQFGREKHQPYIAMELLLGGCLDKMIAEGEPLDPALLVKIALDVAEGLRAAGEIGLVHGDIKPENILLDANGNAKVVDFGLAAFMDREGRRDGIWGTPYYIAPEKVRGKPGDQRSDIYSLGATLFHALTLKPPFEGETAVEVVKARLKQPPPLVSDMRPEVHPEIVRVVKRMLEPEPLRRYPTYVSLIADLHNVMDEVGAPRSMTKLKGSSGKIVSPKRAKNFVTSSRLSGEISSSVGKTKEERKKAARRRVKVLLLMFFMVALGGGGWHGWQVYEARRSAMRAVALIEAYRLDADEALEGLGDLLGQTEQKLGNEKPLADAAASRLVEIDQTLLAIGYTEGLAGAAPDILTVPERLETLLTEAETVVAAVRESYQSAIAEQSRLNAASDPESARLARDAILETVAANVPALQAVRSRIDQAPAVYAELETLAVLVPEIRARLEDAERQRLEEERRQREQEARRREEEEQRRKHVEQVQAEETRLTAVRQELLPLILRNDFDAAIERARGVQPDLTTTEVRGQAERLVERLELLPTLKKVVVSQLRVVPWPWGWLGRLDIVGADEEGMHLTNRRVPWTDVPPAQMVRFIERYADAAEIERVQRADFNLAAAAYYYENGRLDEAQKHAQKAVGYQVRLRERVRLMMPEVEDL